MATYNDIKKIKIGDNTFVFHVPTASEVGALPSSTTIPSITLNGAANTSPSFYAPTTAGTNGYVLKSNGSGAPTWTSATLTDTKVTTAALTSGTLYYPILATGTGTATRQIDSTLKGLTYKSTAGTASTVGTATLTLGNSTASGTANNEKGQLVIYGSTAYAHTISGAPTAARTLSLPDEDGTFAINLSNLQDGSGTGSIEMSSADALKSYQVVLGTYNKEDTGTDKDLSNFAFIIGNGTDSTNRSNLFTINKSGLVTTHPASNTDYDWDTSTPPDETQYFTGFEIRDTNEVRLAHMDAHAGSDGNITAVFGAEKIINGEPVRNQIYLRVEADGTKTYVVDNADNFRSAIGLRDAIIERGTSGIWTYRKWESGIAECWGTYSKTASHYATVLGGYAYNSGTVNFPSGLFVSAPICHYSSQCGNGMALTGTITTNLTKDSNVYYTVAQVSGNQTTYWYIYAIGRHTSI